MNNVRTRRLKLKSGCLAIYCRSCLVQVSNRNNGVRLRKFEKTFLKLVDLPKYEILIEIR
jgi:ferredoxin